MLMFAATCFGMSCVASVFITVFSFYFERKGNVADTPPKNWLQAKAKSGMQRVASLLHPNLLLEIGNTIFVGILPLGNAFIFGQTVWSSYDK